jgi:squalene synthase HpnC
VVSGPLDRAYATCAALAQSHYENFPVASRLLPPPMRPHIAAVYAFARIADDIADEGDAQPAARTARLCAWQQRLHEQADTGTIPGSTAPRDDLILAAVAHTIATHDLPLSLFDDLVSAFAQDITTTRYDSWGALLDYCRRSANPVGRLVLQIGGYGGDDLARSSDCLCTALQLANFWQDFGRDWRAGRLYVPADIGRDAGASENDLHKGMMTTAWADALGRCIARTRTWFEQGRFVCDAVGGRLRLELRFTWLGGSRILDRCDARRSTLLAVRPTLGVRDLPALAWEAIRWSAVAV